MAKSKGEFKIESNRIPKLLADIQNTGLSSVQAQIQENEYLQILNEFYRQFLPAGLTTPSLEQSTIQLPTMKVEDFTKIAKRAFETDRERFAQVFERYSDSEWKFSSTESNEAFVNFSAFIRYATRPILDDLSNRMGAFRFAVMLDNFAKKCVAVDFFEKGISGIHMAGHSNPIYHSNFFSLQNNQQKMNQDDKQHIQADFNNMGRIIRDARKFLLNDPPLFMQTLEQMIPDEVSVKKTYNQKNFEIMEKKLLEILAVLERRIKKNKPKENLTLQMAQQYKNRIYLMLAKIHNSAAKFFQEMNNPNKSAALRLKAIDYLMQLSSDIFPYLQDNQQFQYELFSAATVLIVNPDNEAHRQQKWSPFQMRIQAINLLSLLDKAGFAQAQELLAQLLGEINKEQKADSDLIAKSLFSPPKDLINALKHDHKVYFHLMVLSPLIKNLNAFFTKTSQQTLLTKVFNNPFGKNTVTQINKLKKIANKNKEIVARLNFLLDVVQAQSKWNSMDFGTPANLERKSNLNEPKL